MIRLAVSFLLFGCIVACSAPPSRFDAQPVTRVTVEDSVFDIRVDGHMAESIRVNSEYAPRFGPIRDKAATAIAQVSGCRVTQVIGDAAVQYGRLDCPGVDTPPLPVASAENFDCMEVRTGVTRADGTEYLDYECYAF